MAFPEFFDRISPIVLRDPLAELLGAAEGGLIEYRFADAVKLAGHACPTVAGAWLMATRALRTLYGEATPERGNFAVASRERQEIGVAGVIASIATLLTGAAGDGGFKGLGGQYQRRHLLRFGVAGIAGLAFHRLDNGASVDCVLRLDSVPPDPQMGRLLPLLLEGSAGDEERRRFAELWQDRVKRILVDHADDPTLVELRPFRT